MSTVHEVIDRLRGIRFVGLVAEVAFFLAAGAPALGVAALALLGGFEPVVGEASFAPVEAALRRVVHLNLSRGTADRALAGLGQLLDGGAWHAAVAFATTVVLSSRGLTGAMRGLGHLYGTERHRPLWRDALVALGFATGAAVIGALATVGVLLGAARGSTFADVYAWARWVVVPAALVAHLTTLYWWCAGCDAPWHRDVPGALLATAGTVAAGTVYVAYVGLSPGLGLGPALGPAVGAVLATFTLVFAIAGIVLVGGAVNAVRRPALTRDAPRRTR